MPVNVQLDQNRIAIRERAFTDVLDLALRVGRVYLGPLVAIFACTVIPLMALNAWLLADLIALGELDFEAGFISYAWMMLLLMLWEAPLVTAPITLYLGQALFAERPRSGRLVRDLFGSLPQMVWYQLGVRAVFLPLPFTWFLPYAVWPYLSEVILLERNPWHGRSGRQSTRARTMALHGGYVGDLFVRWIASVGVGLLLFLSAWFSLVLLGSMSLNAGLWESSTFTVCFPLAMWLVIGYFAVVRFLGYLDLRIRREGWEVELLLRAEETRLTKQLS